MPIDASIYGQIQQPQQQNPLNALAQAYQIKGYQAQMDKADRAEQQQNKLLQLVGSPEFSRMDAQGKAGALQGVGDFENAGRVITSAAAANKDQREAEKVELAMAIDRYQQSSGAFAEIAKNPAAAQQILGQMVQAKVIDPKYAQQVLTSASQAQDPAQFWMQGANAAISAKDKLTLQMQQRGQDITRQNSIDSNATSTANNANTVAVQRDRLAFDQSQPKGQVVQTDSGTMLVDPRTGEARPVTSGGVPVQKPGKDIPANVNKSIIDNQQSLGKIDRAIESITSNPKALGLQYAIPGAETVGQYLDSEGVPTRAAVADVGSLVLHDRSGAAVTVSEFPRLKPFIPTASDDPKAAVAKLRQLRKAMAEEADLLSQTYSKEQGFKESPVLKSAGNKPAAPAKTKVVGGKTYAFDGKGWYVAE
jgi:hypothetical protein